MFDAESHIESLGKALHMATTELERAREQIAGLKRESSRPEWLGEQRPAGEDPGYAIADLRAKFECRQLPGGWLVLERHADGLWMRFAVLRFVQSNIDGSDELDEVVFHGDGTLDGLRECRHTYWGEDGYLFYPEGKLITAALRELSEFFDDLATPETDLSQVRAELAEHKRRNKAAEKHLSEFASVHYAIDFAIDILTGAATGPEVGI